MPRGSSGAYGRCPCCHLSRCHVTMSRSLVMRYTPHWDLCFRMFPVVSRSFQKLLLCSVPFRTLPYTSMDFYEFPHASQTFLNLPHVSRTFSHVLFDPMFPLMDYSSHGLLSMVLIMAQSLHHDGVIAQSACGYAPPSPHVYKDSAGCACPSVWPLGHWNR
jgi:hypothetical protein